MQHKIPTRSDRPIDRALHSLHSTPRPSLSGTARLAYPARLHHHDCAPLVCSPLWYATFQILPPCSQFSVSRTYGDRITRSLPLMVLLWDRFCGSPCESHF
ncbi:hypothetical protein KC19_4G053600 [Ceratodon purpureus]|uniref:Uncharacterized protein n=1 Tax=Ceratodon purpureus TaxID=3225 RepID=A0A8T0I5Y2_CERPU|nr:hypothetical protein KC19_4G053600 [Ceratodon purpureus]